MIEVPEVRSRGGIVAASQSLAVQAGIEILGKGGSAIDAAIAVSAAITVVEPGASHLGGDAFVITHDASTREQLAFNGSGEAPHGAVAEAFGEEIPKTGFKAATVPGLVSTWFAIHQVGGRLPMTDLLAPAIKLANEGFEVTHRFKARIDHHLKLFPETNLFDCLGIRRELNVGELISQPLLANSLKAIATNGRAAFYEGEIAESLVTATDGWFSTSDLASHQTRVGAPLTIPYRDYLIHGQPPPSQGMILLEELLIAEGFDLANMPDADRIHLMVEAKKIAFADRYELLGDPDLIEIDLKQLFAPESITSRRKNINLAMANNTAHPNRQEGSDTTYFLTADRDGNAVSWIQSVFHNFGASWAIPNTGIIMNNRLTGFSLDPHSPNFIAPGKRPAHTLNAWIATHKDRKLFLVGGTPGANVQVQTNFQLIVNAIDLKMSPATNVTAPRWQHLNKSDAYDEVEDFDGVLEIEDRVVESTREDLAKRGHILKTLSPFGHASAVQLLELKPDGTFLAASDPRSGGSAQAIQ